MAYGPPSIYGSELAQLVSLAGGPRSACRLLAITDRTLRRWQAGQDAPAMALRLLWYAGPHGRRAAALDAENELRITRGLADALQADLDRLRALLAAALAARSDGAANDPVTPDWRGPLPGGPTTIRRSGRAP